ncbi:MAG: hypothetical protein V5A62_02215 [Haloarculaceae archaeon]
MERTCRRALLTALLAGMLMLAGCTAVPGGGGDGTRTPTLTPVTPPTGSPPGTSTPTPGECDTVEQGTVDPFREDVEPSELPDPPAEWNRSSIERYVVAFEEAYSRNAALRTTSTRVEVIVGDVSVERSGDTWVVELTSRTNTWAQGRATGTATATVVHGDGARIPVTYHLTDRGLYRTQRSVGGPSSGSPTATPDRGIPVACFEG